MYFRTFISHLTSFPINNTLPPYDLTARWELKGKRSRSRIINRIFCCILGIHSASGERIRNWWSFLREEQDEHLWKSAMQNETDRSSAKRKIDRFRPLERRLFGNKDVQEEQKKPDPERKQKSEKKSSNGSHFEYHSVRSETSLETAYAREKVTQETNRTQYSRDRSNTRNQDRWDSLTSTTTSFQSSYLPTLIYQTLFENTV